MLKITVEEENEYKRIKEDEEKTVVAEKTLECFLKKIKNDNSIREIRLSYKDPIGNLVLSIGLKSVKYWIELSDGKIRGLNEYNWIKTLEIVRRKVDSVPCVVVIGSRLQGRSPQFLKR